MTDHSAPTSARPPIDLDEFERQLRSMQSQAKSGQGDPLAELARIVGQDDPFHFSQGSRQPPVHAEPLNTAPTTPRQRSLEFPAAWQTVSAGASPVRTAPVFDELSKLRDEHPVTSHFPEAKVSEATKLSAFDRLIADHEGPNEGGPAPDFLSARRDTHSEPGPSFENEPVDEFSYDEPPRKSGSGFKIFGGLAALGLVAVGGIWAMGSKSDSSLTTLASAPVIAAKPGAFKEKPANPGGVEVPNLNADILQKAKPDNKEVDKVTPREEQPVDLGQAAKKDIRRVDLGQPNANGAAPVVLVPVPTGPAASNTAAPVTATSQAGNSAAVAAGNSVSATQPSSSIQAAVPSVPVSPSVPGGPRKVQSIKITNSDVAAPAKTDAEPKLATAPKPVVPRPKPAASTPVATTSAAPKPKQVADDTTPSANSDTPLQIAPPPGVSRKATAPKATTTPVRAPAPKPAKVALAAPAAEASDSNAAASEAPAPKAAASSGGKFSVQFGAPGSTEEANSLISKLKSQYPSVMGAISTRVIKADVNGRSVYRVRSSTVSKDRANQLCSDMKAAGGNCFISGG